MSPSFAPLPQKPPGKRLRRMIIGLLVLGFVLWQVVVTERHVMDLRTRGFTAVAIDSARNHAYLPLLCGLVGAALSLAIAFGAKRLLRR